MRLTLAPLLASSLLLAACGGGGEGSGAGAPPSNPNPFVDTPPPVATNTVAAQVDAGVFFFGGAGSTVNGVSQTYIRKVAHGVTSGSSTALVTTRFAGADSVLSNGLFDAISINTLKAEVNDWVYDNGQYVSLIYGDNHKAEMASRGWDLEVSHTALAGTPISAYLAQARTGANAPPVTGNFGVGAEAIGLTYRAKEDKILYFGSFVSYLRDVNFATVKDLAGFATSSTCLRNLKTGKALAIRYRTGGVADLYDVSANTPNQCSGTLPVSFGQATYTQKTFGRHGYLDFTFPAGFNLSQYSAAFTPAEFAAGVRFVIGQSVNNNGWAAAYYLPANATLGDGVKHMNLKAAEDLKAVLALP